MRRRYLRNDYEWNWAKADGKRPTEVRTVTLSIFCRKQLYEGHQKTYITKVIIAALARATTFALSPTPTRTSETRAPPTDNNKSVRRPRRYEVE